jgi:hypothetical protein
MNKYVEEQLKKVKVADLSNYDENTHTYHIPKYNEFRYEVDKCYLVKLDKMLLNGNDLPILVSNWNKGTFPTNEFLKIDVTKVLGKMICVNGLGYDFERKEDLNTMWSGWLPIQQIKMIERL